MFDEIDFNEDSEEIELPDFAELSDLADDYFGGNDRANYSYDPDEF